MDTKVNLDKRQSIALAVSIINDIEKYVDEHTTEFEEFLESEEKNKKKKGSHRND